MENLTEIHFSTFTKDEIIKSRNVKAKDGFRKCDITTYHVIQSIRLQQ